MKFKTAHFIFALMEFINIYIQFQNENYLWMFGCILLLIFHGYWVLKNVIEKDNKIIDLSEIQVSSIPHFFSVQKKGKFVWNDYKIEINDQWISICSIGDSDILVSERLSLIHNIGQWIVDEINQDMGYPNI